MLRLSVSNIAWPVADRTGIYALLRERGVEGVEIAPTKIAPWDDLTEEAVAAERALLASFGLSVSSYQALYFGRPDLQLLGEAAAFEALVAHTVRVARVAEQLSGGGPGVFGAPRNRLRGSLDDGEARDLGAERFRILAEAVAPYGFVLVLEPAPPQYGGDFLPSTADCAEMVERVDHPALRLHLDTGCVELAGDDGPALVDRHARLLGHAHLSRPQLVPVDGSAVADHGDLLRALAREDYGGWLAIEMRETEQAVADVAKAITAVQAHFAG